MNTDKSTQAVKLVNDMCIESLSPDVFEKWETVKNAIENTRGLQGDSGVTLVIRIRNSDSKLPQKEWSDCIQWIKREVEVYSKNIHFFGGSVHWHPWQSVAWIITCNEDNSLALRQRLGILHKTFNKSVIYWSEFAGSDKFIQLKEDV